MRIERISVDGFGRLTDFDTGPDPLGQLVVVLGPNEGGKSTLFSFLTTALYGFSPASRDTNPHIPWGTTEASGRIHVRLPGEDRVILERRLRSTPAGRVIRGEHQVDLRNQPLEAVRHVPRTVFRQVFALTLAELAGLDDETWSRIQDRVLGSMGASDLASARDVAERLEQEAGEIWRPNRRGNQRLRELRDDIRAIRARRNEAVARDREIRARTEDLESMGLRLQDVRRDLKRDRIVVERIQDLLPLKRQLDRVASLRLEGGARGDLAGLPDDLTSQLNAREEEVGRLRERMTAIDHDLSAPARTVEAYGEPDRLFVESAGEIDVFLRNPDSARVLASRQVEVEAQRGTLKVEVEAVEQQLFEHPPGEDIRARIAAISADILRDRVQRLEESKRSGLERGDGPEVIRSRHPWVPGLVVAVGGTLLTWGILSSSSLAVAIGVGILAGGVFYARPRPVTTAGQPSSTDSADQLDAEIRRTVTGLGIRAEYSEPVGLPLVAVIERTQQQWVRLEGLERSLEGLNARLQGRQAMAVDLARTLRLSDPDDVASFEADIESRLREARSRRDAARQASGEHDRLSRMRQTIAEDVERMGRQLDSLQQRIAGLGRGDTDRAIEEIQRRLNAHARADQIEEELDRTHPDLSALKEKIMEVRDPETAWNVSEDEVTERRVRIEDAEAQIEDLVGRMRAVERDVAHLREQVTIDAIDGELEALRETEAALVAERDRKWVLAQLVREADRRFRDEHQPDLLRRASSYLQRLTQGRYERLMVDPRGTEGLFYLMGPALAEPVPLRAPISTGTLEQAYLALRLAIVDHLDHEPARLPLFMDEAFVNWDAARREQGLSVLEEVSAERQVFAFTCHPDMAERLVQRGAQIVRTTP